MKSIKYTPRYDYAIQGRAVNICRSFYPKLAKDHDFDDLLQEAYIVYMRVKSKYGAVVDNRAWFMVLFSRSLINRMITLLPPKVTYISIEHLDFADEPSTDPEEHYLRRVIAELPEKAKLLLDLVTAQPPKEGERRRLLPEGQRGYGAYGSDKARMRAYRELMQMFKPQTIGA